MSTKMAANCKPPIVIENTYCCTFSSKAMSFFRVLIYLFCLTVQTNSPTARGDQVNTSRNTDLGSNGQKLSKFQRPDPDDDDSQWLCSHYKRRCYVKFECCNKFWPCHRCHNNQSTCGRRKLKSRDTKQIKCVACGQEQQVRELRIISVLTFILIITPLNQRLGT